MKQEEVETVGPKEMRMIKILSSFGWTPLKAKCAVYFVEHERAYSGDIEKTMNLRQPEVSIGLKSLVMDGLIERKPEKQKNYCGRGRRRLKFQRTMSKNKYAEAIANVGKKKIRETERLIEECKKIKQEVAQRAKK